MDREAIEAQIVSLVHTGNWEQVATVALRAYGPHILAYLRSILRDDQLAGEVFSSFLEKFWRSIQRFRAESSFRTWSFGVAWHTAKEYKRGVARKREVRLGTQEISRIVQEVRESTNRLYKTETRDRWEKIRESLTTEERSLLLLRLTNRLPWREVAQIMADAGDPASEAALRKRFERLREKVRGLLDGAAAR